MNAFRLSILSATVTLGPCLAGAAVSDSFDSIDPAWTTDRYEPHGFTVENFGGDNRLRIDIDNSDSAANRPGSYSGPFYNTQGRQQALGISGNWTVSADLYVDSAFNTTTGTLVRTDLWGRDNNADENSAKYPIFGITNASPTDGFNPAAGDRSFRFRVWDGDTTNGWVDLATPSGFTFDAWHNLSISYDGSSFTYHLDGSLIHTDTTPSAPADGELRTGYLQAYNFGHEAYAVRWDNFTAVPEPASLALLALGGAVMLGRTTRRKA